MCFCVLCCPHPTVNPSQSPTGEVLWYFLEGLWLSVSSVGSDHTQNWPGSRSYLLPKSMIAPKSPQSQANWGDSICRTCGCRSEFPSPSAQLWFWPSVCHLLPAQTRRGESRGWLGLPCSAGLGRQREPQTQLACAGSACSGWGLRKAAVVCGGSCTPQGSWLSVSGPLAEWSCMCSQEGMGSGLPLPQLGGSCNLRGRRSGLVPHLWRSRRLLQWPAGQPSLSRIINCCRS